MKIHIPKIKVSDPEFFIRRCGYGRLMSRMTRQVSYVKRVHGDLYPRFHVYVLVENDNWVLNLHLDQRAPVYEGVTAHSGEYDGLAVEKEAERIKGFID